MLIHSFSNLISLVLFKFYKYRRLVNDYTIDDVRSPSDSVPLYLARVMENTEVENTEVQISMRRGGKGEGVLWDLCGGVPLW